MFIFEMLKIEFLEMSLFQIQRLELDIKLIRFVIVVIQRQKIHVNIYELLMRCLNVIHIYQKKKRLNML